MLDAIACSSSENHGEYRFSCGGSVLNADDEGRHGVVRSADEAGLSQAQSIVEPHLLRFAFRGAIRAFGWRRQAPVV